MSSPNTQMCGHISKVLMKFYKNVNCQLSIVVWSKARTKETFKLSIYLLVNNLNTMWNLCGENHTKFLIACISKMSGYCLQKLTEQWWSHAFWTIFTPEFSTLVIRWPKIDPVKTFFFRSIHKMSVGSKTAWAPLTLFAQKQFFKISFYTYSVNIVMEEALSIWVLWYCVKISPQFANWDSWTGSVCVCVWEELL